MGQINDEVQWETTVYSIDLQTPVVGGSEGSANRAATQLANRTQWLKAKIQGMEGGALPFSDLAAVNAAITAGTLKTGMFVSVRSQDPTIWIEEYQIVNGSPVTTEKKVLSAEATELVVNPSETDPDGITTGLLLTVSGQPFRVNYGETGDIAAIVYKNDNGTARRINVLAGNGAVRRFNELFVQASQTGPYFAIADRFGRIGQGLQAWYENGKFGTPQAIVSATGLDTDSISLQVLPGPDAFIDSLGRARFITFGSDSGNGTVTAFNDSVTVTEPDAVDLWVLGGNDWKTGRIHRMLLTAQGGELTRQSCVEMPPVTGAVTAPVKELAVQTLTFVVQVPHMTDVNTSVMLYSFTNSASSAGVRCWFRLRDDGALTLSTVRYDANSPLSGTVLPPHIMEGDYIFVAHIIKMDNNDENYQVLYIGGQPFKKLSEFNTVTRILSTRNIGLGNAYYTTAGWTSTPTVIAEFCAFDYALSESETEKVFRRANVRMKMRSIPLSK